MVWLARLPEATMSVTLWGADESRIKRVAFHAGFRKTYIYHIIIDFS
jgi:hypothetical protein